jgi:SAM-dependent methyltransferase
MKQAFPYFKLRRKEDEDIIRSELKIFREHEKAFSKMYFYLFLYPFLEVSKIKPSNDLHILKFDVWEESSLQEAKIRQLPFLIKKIFDPREIYFVDIDKKLVKMAKRNMRFFGFRKAVVKNGDIKDLPFSDEKFDIVIDFSTTDHLPLKDLKKTIKEVYRVLRGGGIYLVYHLNSDYFNIKRWNYYYKKVNVDSGKLPSFPRKLEKIKSLLKTEKFVILREGYCFPFYFDATLFIYYRLLLNKIYEVLPVKFIFTLFNFSFLHGFFYLIVLKEKTILNRKYN